ncbi:MAG: ABC transporter permease [Ignavibacteria bacterium]|nr:ABC transporter permease [Ignavibacteria bacterium]
MNYSLFIASRYLFSRNSSGFIHFITLISVLGVTLGVAALIIATSIMNGFEKEIKEKVSGLVAHIQVSSFKSEGLPDYQEAIAIIKDSVNGITGISPIVQKEAVLRTKAGVEGLILKGIVPETDVSSAQSKILKGEFNLNPVDSTFSRLVVGNKLADKMKIDIGSKVIVFGLTGIPSPANTPKIKQFIVSGIYESGLREYDDMIVYTDLLTAQNTFALGESVTGIEIKLNNIDSADIASNIIKRVAGYPYYPRSLFRLYKPLFTWVELQKAPTPIILGLIIIVATFNIVGTLLMLVLEKTQSIGILKSLGSSRGGIMKVFLANGIIIGVIGIIFGNILGLGICIAEQKFRFFSLPDIYYMKNVPILIEPMQIMFISSLALILTFLATIIPAYLASRLDPVRSLRFS